MPSTRARSCDERPAVRHSRESGNPAPGRAKLDFPPFMAGLGPAIHETREEPTARSWMPGPSPGTNDTKIRQNSYGSAMSLLIFIGEGVRDALDPRKIYK